jgi:hypothetical protein
MGLKITTLYDDNHNNDAQRNDTQHNDAQHNDVQHNDARHNDNQHNDNQHNDAKRNDAKHNDAKRNDAKRNDAKRNDAKRNDAKRNDAKRNDAKHKDAQRNDTKRNDTQHIETLPLIVAFIIRCKRPRPPKVLHPSRLQPYSQMWDLPHTRQLILRSVCDGAKKSFPPSPTEMFSDEKLLRIFAAGSTGRSGTNVIKLFTDVNFKKFVIS